MGRRRQEPIELSGNDRIVLGVLFIVAVIAVICLFVYFGRAPSSDASPGSGGSATPQCRTGCPCGNACIDCSKRCRR